MAKEIRALTGIRGVAALNVAILHINRGAIREIAYWFPFHNVSVDIFFCLSSFTLCMVYGAGQRKVLDWRGFAAARFARIYPLYFLVFVFSTLYTVMFEHDFIASYSTNALLADWFRQLFMLNALPVIGNGAHWTPPMWSLSIEAFCYAAVFPVLFAWSGRAGSLLLVWKVLMIIASSLLVAIFYVRFYNPLLNAHNIIPIEGVIVHWVAIIRGIGMFVAGWVAWLILLNHPRTTAWAGRNASWFLFGIGVILFPGLRRFIDPEWIVLLTPFLIVGLVESDSFARGGSENSDSAISGFSRPNAA